MITQRVAKTKLVRTFYYSKLKTCYAPMEYNRTKSNIDKIHRKYLLNRTAKIALNEILMTERKMKWVQL